MVEQTSTFRNMLDCSSGQFSAMACSLAGLSSVGPCSMSSGWCVPWIPSSTSECDVGVWRRQLCHDPSEAFGLQGPPPHRTGPQGQSLLVIRGTTPTERRVMEAPELSESKRGTFLVLGPNKSLQTWGRASSCCCCCCCCWNVWMMHLSSLLSLFLSLFVVFLDLDIDLA